jgi:hypothetical protein
MVCLRQNVCLAPEVDIALRLAFDPAGSKCPYLGSFQLLLSEEIDARRSLPIFHFLRVASFPQLFGAPFQL